MAASTPVSSIPYSLLSDAPNANTLSFGIANALDHIVIPKYASTGARDAANITPIEGDMCYVTGTGFMAYDGSSWYLIANSSGWSTWTPTWSTSSGLHTPTLGNGSFNNSWTQIGRFVYFNFQMAIGTTTSFNSGTNTDNWRFTLPVTPVASQLGVGMFFVQPTNTGLDALTCRGDINSAQTLEFVIASGFCSGSAVSNSGIVDAVSPKTWTSTSGPVIIGQGIYRVA